MHKYELTIVLEGKTTAAKKKSAIEKLTKIITAVEGKVAETRDMGELPLAYPIAKNEAGVFLHFVLDLSGEGAKKLTDKLRVEDTFIRSLLVKQE